MIAEKILFIHQLKSCLNSGIPLKKSLEIIQKNNKKNNKKISKIYQEILAGENLIKSLHRYLQSPLTQHMTHIEKVHNLKSLLHELYAEITNNKKHHEELIKSLRYPLILLISTVLLIQINFNFFIPNCINFLQENNLAIPRMFNVIIKLNQHPIIIKKSILPLIIISIITMITIFRHRLKELISLYHPKNTVLWLLAINLKNGFSPYESIKNINFSKKHSLYKIWSDHKKNIKENASFIREISRFCKLNYLEESLLIYCQNNHQMSEQFMIIYKEKQEQKIKQIKKYLSMIHPCCLTLISIIISFLLYCSLVPMLESIHLLS